MPKIPEAQGLPWPRAGTWPHHHPAGVPHLAESSLSRMRWPGCGAGDAVGPVAVPVQWVPSLGAGVAHPRGSGASGGTPKQEGLAGADKGPAWLEESSSPAIAAQKPGDSYPSRTWRGKQERRAALGKPPKHLACPACQRASRAAACLISVIPLTQEVPKLRHFQDILVSVLKGE